MEDATAVPSYDRGCAAVLAHPDPHRTHLVVEPRTVSVLGRWRLDGGWAGAAKILTWAEKDMPENEQRAQLLP